MVGYANLDYFAEVLDVFYCSIVGTIADTSQEEFVLHYKGVIDAFKTAIESGKTDHYTLDQFVSMIIDAEWDERHNRQTQFQECPIPLQIKY